MRRLLSLLTVLAPSALAQPSPFIGISLGSHPPEVNGSVLSLAAHPSGGFVIGGLFSVVDGQTAPHVAWWDGGAWQTLGAGVDGRVNAVAVSGDGTVYAGGQFTSASGVTALNVAAWNSVARRWEPLGSGVTGVVGDLLIGPDGRLYVAGDISLAGGVAAQGLAAWDPATRTWSAVGGGVPRLSGHRVSAMVVQGGGVYVAGRLVGGALGPAPGVARWDVATGVWSAVGPDLGDGPWDDVQVLAAAHDGTVYAAGSFTRASGPTRFARWTPGAPTWVAVDASVRFPDPSDILTLLEPLPDGRLLVGGAFMLDGDVGTRGLAVWNPTLERWEPAGDVAPASVYAALPLGGAVVLGGRFRRIGSVASHHLAAWAGDEWRSFGAQTDGEVHALAISAAGDLVAGGHFSYIGDTDAAHVARWTAEGWVPLGRGTDAPVLSLATDAHGRLVAGGQFGRAGDVDARHVARWEPTTGVWSALGEGQPAQVETLVGAADGSVLAISAGALSRWTDALGAWEPVPLPPRLVATDATTAPGAPLFVAARDTATYNALVLRQDTPTGAWTEVGERFAGSLITALTLSPGGDLYAGGAFDAAGALATPVARWDGAAWVAVGTTLNGQVSDLLHTSRGDLVATGFLGASGMPTVGHLARWDGARWLPPGGWLDGHGLALAELGDGRWAVAGAFDRAGPVRSPSIVLLDPSRLVSDDPPARQDRPTVRVAPNPASTMATIHVHGVEGRFAIDVLDVVGRRVAAERTREGSGPVDVPTAHLAPGVYAARVTWSSGVRSTRFVVVR